LQRQLFPTPAHRCRKSGSTESKNFDRKASKRKGSGKVVADKKEVKAVIETGAG
jgi:hypothetical protein